MPVGRRLVAARAMGARMRRPSMHAATTMAVVLLALAGGCRAGVTRPVEVRAPTATPFAGARAGAPRTPFPTPQAGLVLWPETQPYTTTPLATLFPSVHALLVAEAAARGWDYTGDCFTV